MSQTKVQLIAPIGVVTATTLETTGVLTATTFVGNTPGTVSGIADGTNINAGIITATSFVGNLTGNAAGLSTTTGHANLGIVTATSFHGSGANLDGVSSGPVAQQAVTADGATTTIDLSSGNLIYMTQSANTTVAFANTEGNTDVVYLVRVKDDTTTARTITWPSGMIWNGGTEPTLLTNPRSTDAQVFKLTTRDNGATWYGVEAANISPQTFSMFMWGQNGFGELAQNNRTALSSPVQVPGTWTQLAQVSGNDTVSYAGGVKSDGTLWSWGYNKQGSLGVNNTTYYSSPVQIPGTTWANLYFGGPNAALATRTDGTLWSWGYQEFGVLGQNQGGATKYSSPVQIPGTTWGGDIGMDAGSAMAIKTDGTLWSWGYNEVGNLGTINRTNYSSPVQIPGTTWSKISGGFSGSSAAIRTDGTLWTWGTAGDGALGLNAPNNEHKSSPTQVPGTTWSEISTGYRVHGAIKTDGTLWVWGANTNGKLGLNASVNAHKSSPTQIPGTTWSDVIMTEKAGMFALKTDNTLWAWGYGNYGTLGQNQDGAMRFSSPVQIPGTTWGKISGIGNANAIGFKISS